MNITFFGILIIALFKIIVILNNNIFNLKLIDKILIFSDLTSVVEGYIANLESMELPEDLQGKDKIIFANIQQIREFHEA